MSLAEIKRQFFLDLLDECGVEITINPYFQSSSKPLMAHRIVTFNENTYEVFNSYSAKRLYRVLASEITFEMKDATVIVNGSEFEIVHSHPQDDDNIIIYLYVQ